MTDEQKIMQEQMKLSNNQSLEQQAKQSAYLEAVAKLSLEHGYSALFIMYDRLEPELDLRHRNVFIIVPPELRGREDLLEGGLFLFLRDLIKAKGL